METASTYFTRRAEQERTKAAEANSAEARKAHLELAVRLVRVATTERPLWSEWGKNLPGGTTAQPQTYLTPTGLGDALSDAFPLPPSGAFKHLLDAMEDAGVRRLRRASMPPTVGSDWDTA